LYCTHFLKQKNHSTVIATVRSFKLFCSWCFIDASYCP